MVNDPAAQDSLYSADAAQDGMLDRESDQPVNDTWITTKVKSSLLADSDVSGLDINVETVNGVVTLSGDVEQQSQVEHATRIAREIEGVTDVNNTALVAR
ncbi:BON domain-containing protein [Luteimonas aestuarii]|uniref:Osmotically-inducible protein Y n=2 Tax=Luteimonas aestuarii TaxID=453837 RepID=A0A4R5TTX9_9GAMM|nr:BON domain-containing protein [Luteimonas aestuarii]